MATVTAGEPTSAAIAFVGSIHGTNPLAVSAMVSYVCHASPRGQMPVRIQNR